jgi:hypothetical protein
VRQKPTVSCQLSLLSELNNQGFFYDHGSLVKAIEVDVVISAIGYFQVADQTRIIAAVNRCEGQNTFSLQMQKTICLEFFFLNYKPSCTEIKPFQRFLPSDLRMT